MNTVNITEDSHQPNLKQKTRNSNVELLRIVLILMVISLHYLNGADWAGGALSHVAEGSFNYYAAHLVEAACIMAVNAFVLITGYFSCNKTSISLAKPVKLYGLLVLYGIIFSVIMLGVLKPAINFDTLQFVANTIFYRWFVVTYCVLYLLIPFLNKFIHAVTQKQLLVLLGINMGVFYVINTFSPWKTVMDEGYGIVNFICLYLVGAYLRLYRPEPLQRRKSILVFVICVLLTTIFSCLSHSRAWSYLSVFNLISAVAIFELFRGVNLCYSAWVNYLASYTFAIYIIHGCGPVPPFLYRTLFQTPRYWNSPYMLVNLLVCVLGIYGICVGIEFLRRCLLSWIWDRQLDKIPYKISCE